MAAGKPKADPLAAAKARVAELERKKAAKAEVATAQAALKAARAKLAKK